MDHGASLPGTLCTKAGYFIELTRKDASVEFPSPCDGSESALRSVFGGLDKENRAPSKECNLYRQELFPRTGSLEVRITEASAAHSMNHTRPRGGQ